MPKAPVQRQFGVTVKPQIKSLWKKLSDFLKRPPSTEIPGKTLKSASKKTRQNTPEADPFMTANPMQQLEKIEWEEEVDILNTTKPKPAPLFAEEEVEEKVEQKVQAEPAL